MVLPVKKDKSWNIWSAVTAGLIVACIFIAFYKFYMPHDFNNLGGKHAWVSGSTIKYVNMWLEEGASKLHFTNYEFFSSVEKPSLQEREPYVSYPTGVTFMVWSAARVLGRNHIDISFLKHFQLAMYALETVLMSLIAYSILSIKEKAGEPVKILLSVATAVLWMTIPVNNWFLSNIYWTDLAVFLWILAFLFLECITDTTVTGGKLNVVPAVLKGLVIFAGVLTEYYFWIVVFCAFVINLLNVAINSKENRLKKCITGSLQYVIPVIAGIGIYVWQMSYTRDWLQQLEETFLHRTGAQNNEAGAEMFIKNFCEAITCGSQKRALGFIIIELMVAVIAVVKLFKDKRVKSLLGNKTAAVVFIMVLTPILQIFAFSNHSAIHQYAMTKIGINIVGCIILAYISRELFSKKAVQIGYCLIVLAGMLLVLGYPGQVRNYYYEKNSEPDYTIDRIIAANTDYNDVCFSYTYSVSNNPPMDICVSEKAVYLIENTEDMYCMFPGLADSAERILVVDKQGLGSNDYIEREKTDEIRQQEEECALMGETVYDDEYCSLIRILNKQDNEEK